MPLCVLEHYQIWNNFPAAGTQLEYSTIAQVPCFQGGRALSVRRRFHGMEEVVSSNLTRCTKTFHTLNVQTPPRMPSPEFKWSPNGRQPRKSIGFSTAPADLSVLRGAVAWELSLGRESPTNTTSKPDMPPQPRSSHNPQNSAVALELLQQAGVVNRRFGCPARLTLM